MTGYGYLLLADVRRILRICQRVVIVLDKPERLVFIVFVFTVNIRNYHLSCIHKGLAVCEGNVFVADFSRGDSYMNRFFGTVVIVRICR